MKTTFKPLISAILMYISIIASVYLGWLGVPIFWVLAISTIWTLGYMMFRILIQPVLADAYGNPVRYVLGLLLTYSFISGVFYAIGYGIKSFF